MHIAGPVEFLSVRLIPPLQAHGLNFRLQTGNRDRIRTLLDEGVVDLAVTTSKPDNATHGDVEIGREKLLLVAAPETARKIKGRSLTASLLGNLPCLAYDEHLPLLREFILTVWQNSLVSGHCHRSQPEATCECHRHRSRMVGASRLSRSGLYRLRQND